MRTLTLYIYIKHSYTYTYTDPISHIQGDGKCTKCIYIIRRFNFKYNNIILHKRFLYLYNFLIDYNSFRLKRTKKIISFSKRKVFHRILSGQLYILPSSRPKQKPQNKTLRCFDNRPWDDDDEQKLIKSFTSFERAMCYILCTHYMLKKRYLMA